MLFGMKNSNYKPIYKANKGLALLGVDLKRKLKDLRLCRIARMVENSPVVRFELIRGQKEKRG